MPTSGAHSREVAVPVSLFSSLRDELEKEAGTPRDPVLEVVDGHLPVPDAPGLGVDRLAQPRAHVGLPAPAGRLRDVDREARGDGREERLRVAHRAPLRAVPADPGVLHDLVGLRRASHDPVGDAEQARADALERGCVGV